MELRDKEQYENIIELLKRTLSFYADKNNYKEEIKDYGFRTMIEADKGVQARIALKQIDEIIELLKNSEIDYDDLINDANEQINPQNIINNIKKINKNENQI